MNNLRHIFILIVTFFTTAAAHAHQPDASAEGLVNWRCSIRGTPTLTGRGRDLAPLFVSAANRSSAMQKAAVACIQRESRHAGSSLARQVCNSAFLNNQGGYCNLRRN